MAVITGLITINGKQVLEVSADPSTGAGTPASKGSLALFEGGSGEHGKLYIKIDSSNTQWEPLATGPEVEAYAAGLVENQINEFEIAKAPSQAAVYSALFAEASLRAAEDTRVLDAANLASRAYTDMETMTRVSEDIRILAESKSYTDMESILRASEDIRVLTESKAYADMVTSAEAVIRSNEDILVGQAARSYADMKAIEAISAAEMYSDQKLSDALVYYGRLDGVSTWTGSNTWLGNSYFDPSKTYFDGMSTNLYVLQTAVSDTIDSSNTMKAPSQAAVYSALALKANLSGGNTFSGAQTFGDNVTIHGDLVIDGSLTYVNTQELTVKDPLITLNKGGIDAAGAGLEFEENGGIAGYFKIALDRNGYEMKVPTNASKVALDLQRLSVDHVQEFANTDGMFVMADSFDEATITSQRTNKFAYWIDGNKISYVGGIDWHDFSQTMTVPHLVASSSFKVSNLTAGVAHVSSTGVFSSSAVSLTADVSGILPVVNGGNGTATGISAAAQAALDLKADLSYVDTQLALKGSLSSVNTWVAEQSFQAGMTLTTDPSDAHSPAVRFRLLPSTQTTDSATTTAAVIAMPSTSHCSLIELRIVGICADNYEAVTYIRTARVKTPSPGSVIVYTVQSDYTSEDISGCDVAISGFMSGVKVDVTGVPERSMSWSVSYVVSHLS